MTGTEVLVLGIDPGPPREAASAACAVLSLDERSGSIVLPAVWHPGWEADWKDFRREVAQLRCVPLQETFHGR